MKTTFHFDLKQFRAGFILLIALLCGAICASSFAYEWTINGLKVEAKVVDFDGMNVTLEHESGKRKSIAVNELEAADLRYLADLLSIHNAGVQQDLQRQQLRQQEAQFASQYVNAWTVRMVDRNGEFGWRNYFAANSLEARRLALQEFPNVRVTSIQRLRRGGGFGIGNGYPNFIQAGHTIVPLATPHRVRN